RTRVPEDMAKLRGSHDHIGCSVPFVCIHPSSLGSEPQSLFTFPQRLSRPPPLGDVSNRSVEPHDAPRRITLSLAPSHKPSGGAVGSDHLQIQLVWLSGPERFVNSMLQPFPTFGRVELGMFSVADRWQIGIAAGNSIKFVGPYDSVSCWVPLPAPPSSQTLRFSELEVFSTQRFFGTFVFCDVDGYAQHALGLSVGQVIEFSLGRYPPYRTVRPNDAELRNVRS